MSGAVDCDAGVPRGSIVPGEGGLLARRRFVEAREETRDQWLEIRVVDPRLDHAVREGHGDAVAHSFELERLQVSQVTGLARVTVFSTGENHFPHAVFFYLRNHLRDLVAEL